MYCRTYNFGICLFVCCFVVVVVVVSIMTCRTYNFWIRHVKVFHPHFFHDQHRRHVKDFLRHTHQQQFCLILFKSFSIIFINNKVFFFYFCYFLICSDYFFIYSDVFFDLRLDNFLNNFIKDVCKFLTLHKRQGLYFILMFLVYI